MIYFLLIPIGLIIFCFYKIIQDLRKPIVPKTSNIVGVKILKERPDGTRYFSEIETEEDSKLWGYFIWHRRSTTNQDFEKIKWKHYES